MVRSRTSLLDRVLAVALAVIMVVAMIPMSTLTAFALSYEAGSDCQEDCGGKLQWVVNPEVEGQHHLVCDNEECVRNALIEAYVIHNEGEGGVDCPLCNPPHAHGEFVYSLENDNKTLVATCGSAGNCDLTDKKVSITIAAPSELEYDGSVKAATISGADEWKTATGNDAPEIAYNAEPKNVGTYTASITVEGTTASVEFAIVKGTPTFTVPTGLTAKYDQTLADVDLPDGFAWEDETVKVGAVGEQNFEATYTPVDTDNYNVVNDVVIKITVGKASSVIAAPSKSGDATHTSITLETIVPTVGNGTVEYGYVENEGDEVTNWQSETTFNGLEGSKTYYFYARVNATENYAAAISAGMPISTLDKKNGDVTLSIEGWTYGDEAKEPVYAVVEGEYDAAKIKVEYATKGESDWSTTVPTKAGEYTVRVVCDANAVWAEAVKTCDFKIEKKEITIEWGNTEFIYNAQEQKPTATITAGIVGTDDVGVVVSGAKTDVGTEYPASVALSGDDSSNYVIKANVSTRFKITSKGVTLTWDTTTPLVHNKDKQHPAVQINDGEIFAADKSSVELVVSGAASAPHQPHTATASLKGEKAANYHIVNATCGFVISSAPTPDPAYTIVKASDGSIATANQNGWYNYDIKIIPADEHTIWTAFSDDGKFAPYITITESQTNYTVYLRNRKGEYTEPIVVGDIKIDKTAPTVSVKLNEDNVWDTFLDVISFGAYDRFFNTTQTVTITAQDASDTNAAGNSGIESVFYHVSNVGMSIDTVKALEDSAWTPGTTATFDNDNDYVVYTKIVDKAGNVTFASSDGFVYDDTKPVINVSFENNNAANERYFEDDRTINVVIIEHNFDVAKVVVDITAKDASGADVDITDFAAFAKNPENWTHDGDEHTLKGMELTANANYTFTVSCEDKAGNKNDGVNYAEGTVAGDQWFCIDKVKPNVSLSVEGLVEESEKPWEWSASDADGLIGKVLTSINFNRWSSDGVTVTVKATDGLSDVDYIEYYKTESVVTDITSSEITWSNQIEEKEFKIDVAPNEKFILYVHVVDNAGNDIYLSSNGIVVDNKAPGGDNYAPDVDITLPDANANGIYNEDDTVKVDFKVVEPKYKGADGKGDAGSFSGIQKITYVIKAEDIGQEQTGEFELTDENTETDTTTGLIGSWTGSITIDKDKFNSNNVVVLITAIDNAGNVHTSTTKVGDIKIDVTDPTIDVSYEDVATVDNEKFFKGDRTATIVVTERNFKVEDVKITIKNTDGVIPEVKWNATSTGSGDETKWTATIIYSADGDYTFDIAYTDLADNACAGAQYGDSIAPTEFTVDKTLPEVSVTYNNNDAKNDKYFAAARTATIVVKEHNFDVNRVTFSQTAKLNGNDITIPTASWANNGDVHTATIVFDKDGDYTFDVTVKDMAGNDSEPANYGNSVAAKDFVVDQTIEKPTIGGVENGKAYKNDVVPTISFTDVNYDTYEVKLVRTRLGEKNVDVTDKFIKSVTEQAQGGSGSYDTFEKIVENDGIYTLTVKMIDKAGNEETEEYTFTVNRFGSVYEYGDELVALIKDGGQYVKNVDGDLVITEYNADRLLAGSLKILITRDGETVDVDFTSNPADINAEVGIGESGWYQYVYTIKASNFDKDGVYKISLTSKYAAVDSPENDSTSVPENSIDEQGNAIVDAMSFTVDSVAPEIRNIVNLDKAIADMDKIVDGKLNVKYTIVDVGGLKTIEIIVNGKTIQTLTAEDIADNLYNFTGSFDLEEQDGTTAHKVQIKVTDLAGNVTDTNSEDFLKAHSDDNENSTYVFFNEVTVSRNFFVRWYANTALFWGSIGGVVVLAAAIWFLIAFKRKKKEEK